MAGLVDEAGEMSPDRDASGMASQGREPPEEDADRVPPGADTPGSPSRRRIVYCGAVVLLGAGILLALFWFRPRPASTPELRTITGTVCDTHGVPLAGATVRFKGRPESVVTNAQGVFALPVDGTEARTLTASLDGYFIAGAAIGDAPIVLTLTPLPENDAETYAWVDPDHDPAGKHNCANCHAEMHREWASSAHARSATGRHFRDLYEGKHGGWGLLTQYPDGSGVCTSCHAPTVAPGDPATFDLREVAGVAAKGVHCDYCHKIAEAPRGRIGLTHGRDGMRVQRPAEGQLFFGPLDDVDRGEDAFLPLYKESRYCASCHEGVLFGVHVYSTYSEWLESPARREGKQCQTCHMKPTGNMTNLAPGKGGIERAPATLAGHHVPGATADMLRGCLKLSVTVTPEPDSLKATVELRAADVGHRVPTGYIDRNLILVIEPTDLHGSALQPSAGPVLPAIRGEPFARKPGKLFAKRLLARDMTPEPFWKTEADVVDSRLTPGKPDISDYRLPKDTRHLRVRLIYRRFWPMVAAHKGWRDNDTTVIDTPIDVAPNQVTHWPLRP